MAAMGGLEIVGSRPSSARDSNRPSSAANRAAIEKAFSNSTFTYADRVFGHQKQQLSNRSDTSSVQGNYQWNGNKQKKKTRSPKESYVDELLFGPKVEGESFRAPWETKPKTKPVLWDCTDYKNVGNQLKKNLAKNRPSSASKKTYKTKHNPGYVDEMLFGPKPVEADFAAPWDDGKSKKIHHFDMTDYKNMSNNNKTATKDTHSNRSRPATPNKPTQRPGSHMGQHSSGLVLTASRPGSSAGQYKSKHNGSFVDETLFGPKPLEADFPAPWEKNERQGRESPFLWDPSPGVGTRESSRRPKSATKSRPATPNKPAWR